MTSIAMPRPVSQASSPVPPHERIAARAYERWCRRGCTHGHDLQDWLEAEAEVRNEQTRLVGKAGPKR